MRKAAEGRRDILIVVSERIGAGDTDRAAFEAAAKIHHACSPRTIRRYWAAVQGLPREHWKLALVAAHKGRTVRREVPEALFRLYVTERNLETAKKPIYAYRATVKDAKRLGIEPADIPSASTLERRYQEHVPRPVQQLRRIGPDAYKHAMPSHHRDARSLRAFGEVSFDGKKTELSAEYIFGKQPFRVVIVAATDVYSAALLSAIPGFVENTELVRACYIDVFTRLGYPDLIQTDNGRAFINKQLMGRRTHGFRYQPKPFDPIGMLDEVGVPHTAAQAYNGRSKPIERRFRDFEEFVQQAEFSKAYLGLDPLHKPEGTRRPVRFEKVASLLTEWVHDYNNIKRPDHPIARGRSYWETFIESYEERKANGEIRFLVDGERRSLLPEKVLTLCSQTAQVRMFGNFYYHTKLAYYTGKLVSVKYNPVNLYDPVWVRDMDGRPLCTAECIIPNGFQDMKGFLESKKKLAAFDREFKQIAAMLPEIPLDVLVSWRETARPSEAPIPLPQFKPSRRVANGDLILDPDAEAQRRAEREARNDRLDAVFEKIGHGFDGPRLASGS